VTTTGPPRSRPPCRSTPRVHTTVRSPVRGPPQPPPVRRPGRNPCAFLAPSATPSGGVPAPAPAARHSLCPTSEPVSARQPRGLADPGSGFPSAPKCLRATGRGLRTLGRPAGRPARCAAPKRAASLESPVHPSLDAPRRDRVLARRTLRSAALVCARVAPCRDPRPSSARRAVPGGTSPPASGSARQPFGLTGSFPLPRPRRSTSAAPGVAAAPQGDGPSTLVRLATPKCAVAPGGCRPPVITEPRLSARLDPRASPPAVALEPPDPWATSQPCAGSPRIRRCGSRRRGGFRCRSCDPGVSTRLRPRTEVRRRRWASSPLPRVTAPSCPSRPSAPKRREARRAGPCCRSRPILSTVSVPLCLSVPAGRSRRSLPGRVMRYVGRLARLQGLSPLESSLSPGGGLDLLVTRCSPGFSTSPGVPPSSPRSRASTSPPLTGFTVAAHPKMGRPSNDPPKSPLAAGAPKSPARLPHRVSESDEAGRSLTKSTYPHEVQCLIVRPRCLKVDGSWLIVSPQVPGCVAVP
jgi:hypothetical protein